MGVKFPDNLKLLIVTFRTGIPFLVLILHRIKHSLLPGFQPSICIQKGQRITLFYKIGLYLPDLQTLDAFNRFQIL